MYKKKDIKFLSIISLVLILVMTNIFPSFASNDIIISNETSEIKFQVLDENSALIVENNERLLLTETESENETLTTLKNLETGNEDYFLVDDGEGTIYSSITGKTIKINDSIDEEEKNVSRLVGDKYIATCTIIQL